MFSRELDELKVAYESLLLPIQFLTNWISGHSVPLASRVSRIRPVGTCRAVHGFMLLYTVLDEFRAFPHYLFPNIDPALVEDSGRRWPILTLLTLFRP